MTSGFYSRIAASNIRKNPRLYVPRMLAETGLLGCFYILYSLAQDKTLTNVKGGSFIPVFMGIGSAVIGLLSVILILYVNSFLMKRRKNEYGLYNVLGMEKRHIVRVLFTESLFASLLSIVAGLAFGVLMYKMASLLICKILSAEVVAGFYYVRLDTILPPALIFLAIDLFAFVVNAITVMRLKPVQLLAQAHTGEKEPKVKWLTLLAGIVCIGIGYYIALTATEPLKVLRLFFLAVFLVIFGTYFLFVAGTTFVLKCLKKNKNYYYKKRHMISVSGLLFRMKQNAVGLASIALLSTGVLVMISSTVSLYSGVEDLINESYPMDAYFSAQRGTWVGENDYDWNYLPPEEMEQLVRSVAEENNLQISNVQAEYYLASTYYVEDQAIVLDELPVYDIDIDSPQIVLVITEDYYNSLMHQEGKEGLSEQLAPNEIAYYHYAGTEEQVESMTIGDQKYVITKVLDDCPKSAHVSMDRIAEIVIVSDGEVLHSIDQEYTKTYGMGKDEYYVQIGFDFEDYEAASALGEDFETAVYDKCQELYPETDETSFSSTVSTKWFSENSMYGLYGSFFFLGILLGFVCLFATILIIYYKQISEGYEDRERFQIMQKVGMEEKEVKKTIGNQLVLTFFLPLITAGIHTAFAFPIVLRMLKLLMLTNSMLFVICSLISFAVFAIVYTTVYLLTARTYYKIVR